MSRRSSSVATPPVGLCGEFRKIARGDGSSRRNRSTSATSGRNSFDWRSGARTARAPRRSMFGTYVGKCGLKTSTPSPGFRNASQKNCSNTFAPGPATTFFGLSRDAELRSRRIRGRLAELGKAGRRAVVRLVVLDRVDAGGLRGRRAGERAVADLELDDVLALGLQRPGHAEHGERGFDCQRSSEVAQLCGHGCTFIGSFWKRAVGLRPERVPCCRSCAGRHSPAFSARRTGGQHSTTAHTRRSC